MYLLVFISKKPNFLIFFPSFFTFLLSVSFWQDVCCLTRQGPNLLLCSTMAGIAEWFILPPCDDIISHQVKWPVAGASVVVNSMHWPHTLKKYTYKDSGRDFLTYAIRCRLRYNHQLTFPCKFAILVHFGSFCIMLCFTD